jgi:hypothetical protein
MAFKSMGTFPLGFAGGDTAKPITMDAAGIASG